MSERKEIIQINGFTILIIIAVVANIVSIGLIYRYHQYQMFLSAKINERAYAGLLQQERMVKNEIVHLENVSNWNATRYGVRLSTLTDTLGAQK